MKEARLFNIKLTAEELVPDKLNRTSYTLTLLVILVMILVIGALWQKWPNVVPLWFTEPWGEARLAPRIWLLVLPGVAMLTMITNLAVSKLVTKTGPLLLRMLSLATVVVAVILFIALLGIGQSILL